MSKAFAAFVAAAGARAIFQYTQKAWRLEDWTELQRLRKEESRLMGAWCADESMRMRQRILATPFGEIPGGCWHDGNGNLFVPVC